MTEEFLPFGIHVEVIHLDDAYCTTSAKPTIEVTRNRAAECGLSHLFKSDLKDSILVLVKKTGEYVVPYWNERGHLVDVHIGTPELKGKHPYIDDQAWDYLKSLDLVFGNI